MGADQHITDPDDRAELVARAYELYVRHGSLRKVREHLAADAATVRICGSPRHFAASTIKDWVEEGRVAETYIDLHNIARERVDLDTRLKLLQSIIWDRYGVHQVPDWPTLLKVVDQLLRIEMARAEALGIKVPIRVQPVAPDLPATIPPTMRATIEAMHAEHERQREALRDDLAPNATVLSTRPRRNQQGRRPPDSRRTS